MLLLLDNVWETSVQGVQELLKVCPEGIRVVLTTRQEAVIAALKGEPIFLPNYEFAEHVNEGDVLLVLGGELECSDVQLMFRQNKQLLQSNGVLCVGNVRSNQEKFDEIVLGIV